jgi:hypothetical protein
MHKLFASQTENEKIYLVIRQHWFVLFVRFFFLSVMAGLLTFVWIWSEKTLGSGLPDLAILILDLLYFSAMLALLLGAFLVGVFYYLHLQIITDMRMVDVDQISLFRRNVSEIFIENVEEPTSRAHGFLATVFDYGDVTVQTSGAQIEFVFERVPYPEAIKKLILDLYERRSQLINPRREKTTAHPLDSLKQ